MDIELQPVSFKNLVHHLDFLALTPEQKKKLRSSLHGKVLRDVPALSLEIFQSLPRSVQRELNPSGVDLAAPQIQAPDPKTLSPILSAKGDSVPSGEIPAPKRAILGLDGKPLPRDAIPVVKESPLPEGLKSSADNLHRTGSGLFLPTLPPPSPWQNVVKRWEQKWNHLTPDERRALYPLESLNPIRKAKAAILVAEDRFAQRLSQHQPPLKEAPQILESVRALLRHFLWHRDGTTMEFKPKYPTSAATFVYLQRAFFKLVGIRDQVDNPNRIPETLEEAENHFGNFHLHVSAKDGRDLTRFATTYNKWLLMQLVDKGRTRFFEERGYAYSEDILAKRLIRLFSDGKHLEVRVHTESPEVELHRLLQLLDMPEDQAIQTMNDEIQAKLTPENMKRLKEHNPSALITTLSDSANNASPDKVRRRLSDPGVIEDIILKPGGSLAYYLSHLLGPTRRYLREPDRERIETSIAKVLHTSYIKTMGTPKGDDFLRELIGLARENVRVRSLLNQKLEDPGISDDAARMIVLDLVYRYSDTREAALKALQSEKPEIRLRWIRALGHLFLDGRGLSQTILKVAGDASEEVRREAMRQMERKLHPLPEIRNYEMGRQLIELFSKPNLDPTIPENIGRNAAETPWLRQVLASFHVERDPEVIKNLALALSTSEAPAAGPPRAIQNRCPSLEAVGGRVPAGG